MQQILKPKDKVVILVDFREGESEIEDLMRSMGGNVKTVNLEVGDYICSDRVCVERKTANDFINSIIDGRLFSQLEELKDNFEKPIIIVEGNNFRESMNDNAIKSALASIILDYEVPIIMSRGTEDTAKIIYWLARREQTQSQRPIGIKGKKKPKDIKKLQEHIISGFPGVSTKISARILKRFKTIKSFANATEQELREIDGIGKELAKKLHGIINQEYVD
ncbi:MAG: ERCC4 domain-containing protein [Candidatus Aenigmatarchaeota archaeon]